MGPPPKKGVVTVLPLNTDDFHLSVGTGLVQQTAKASPWEGLLRANHKTTNTVYNGHCKRKQKVRSGTQLRCTVRKPWSFA